VTGRHGSGRGAVAWLTAQSLVFGAMAALLGIVANAMFLDAYGSEWLPVTYIAIGAAGIVVSGAIARTAERFGLLRIALSVLGAAAVGLGVAWLVARGGEAPWVSVPLLVLFPILVQLGFVFIGGQAGRVLDIAGIKSSFPRIMAGFPVGAVIGGVAGGQLVTLLGRAEDLLLATALAQGAFAALVWVTGRRYATELRLSDPGSPGHRQAGANDKRGGRPPTRALLANPFVGLILAYQVLSALGSQLSDFLVFDRAAAQFPEAADLAGFLAGYTAVMNAVAIGFLILLAGPLIRRFGLKGGIAANPLVMTVFAGAMLAINAIVGATSLGLLAIVAAARIADIALTDGTTRTSINAIYQVLPERARLPVQTAVEGIGVPVAIGISGVLILVLHALPFPLTATIAVTALVCAAWAWAGVRLYRAYGPALVQALDQRPLLGPAADMDASVADEAVALQLLANPDPRAARLGFDLVNVIATPGLAVELAALTHDSRPEVRLAALAGLAGAGDESARRGIADAVREGARSSSPAVRLQAARALEVLGSPERVALSALLEDEDLTVRNAALESVQADDEFAVAPAIAMLGDPRSAEAAAGAVGRLGDAVVPSMAKLLERSGSPAPPLVIRAVRALALPSAARDEVLRRHLAHPDRELALVVAERLVSAGRASEATAVALDNILIDDVRHAARILGALAAIVAANAGGASGAHVADAPLERALRDELELVGLKVRANRVARHGSARLGSVMIELTSGASASGNAGGSRRALALEALDVLLDSAEAKWVLALLHPHLTIPERLARLTASTAANSPSDLAGWLRDLLEDREGRWASPWLRACAIHAASARGLLDRMDLAPARAAGDPLIDEELGA
jgi:HEAT repeat protein